MEWSRVKTEPHASNYCNAMSQTRIGFEQLSKSGGTARNGAQVDAQVVLTDSAAALTGIPYNLRTVQCTHQKIRVLYGRG